MTVLLVVATEGEAARLHDLPARVVVSGVGPVAAALATQAALLSGQGRPNLVVSAGIGGAYPGSGLEPGGAAIASRMVYGDLGAWDGDTFLTLAELGLERPPTALSFPAWPGGEPLAGRLGLRYGPFVTLSAVTGSADGARRLQRQVPGALIEGMEGAGVAQAAALAGVPCT
ncbi:MAG: futalosine hydrolase, partial [Deinococcus sp.]